MGAQVVKDGNFVTLSNAFTAWGQFIIHDILKTPDALQARDDHCGNHFANCTCTKPENVTDDDWQFFCYQISTRNKYDMDKDNIFPLFKEGKRECLPMTRSQAVIQKDNKNNNAFFREQVNSLTSFIDATTVYGTSSKQLNLLLEADK